ncbi:MAG: hypothetical protein EZS28_004001 [Streblomastix strix]|uniref:Uncharacterized protein n=1 Tax=Streblomastix strix TaxID=222440 RepID=A0A5J4X1H0_9EUKA|nr:MAG: hypothetical protein EZS28_004001 [Streblomastix strix]
MLTTLLMENLDYHCSSYQTKIKVTIAKMVKKDILKKINLQKIEFFQLDSDMDFDMKELFILERSVDEEGIDDESVSFLRIYGIQSGYGSGNKNYGDVMITSESYLQ